MMHAREKEITRTTLVGSVVNALMTAGKIIAGVAGNSSAMLADGIHSLSDFISDVVVIVCVRISSKGQDKDHDYGHGKFETLATFFVGIMLLLVGAKLMWGAVTDIYGFLNGEQLHQPQMLALWAALISIVLKEALFRYTALVGKRVNSPVVIANAWHHRTDALSSIGSALGIGGAIFLGDSWAILDPITCGAISLFIVFMALKMMNPSLNELMEASLPDEMEDDMVAIARSVSGVDNVHGLRTRKCGPNFVVEAHIVVNPNISVFAAHEITTQIEKRLRLKYGQETHISLHVEPSENAE